MIKKPRVNLVTITRNYSLYTKNLYKPAYCKSWIKKNNAGQRDCL